MHSGMDCGPGWYPAMPRTVKVFLSHSSEDASTAAHLHDVLTENGFAVWLDVTCLLPGQDFAGEIRDAVATSDIIAVLVSKSSVDKAGYIQREIRLALDHALEKPPGSIYVIPVLVDGTPPPGDLARLHWVDMRSPSWLRRIKLALTDTARATSTRTPIAGIEADPTRAEILDVVVRNVRRPGAIGRVIDYVIRAQPMVTVLGASLISQTNEEYYQRSADRTVLLRPGVASYGRPLPEPDGIPPGEYQLIVSIWRDAIELGRRVDRYVVDEPVTVGR